MSHRYILALDQGTTSSRAIIFDEEQNIIGIAQKEFTQIYPREGWVEHDPMEIYSSQYAVMMEVVAQSGVSAKDIAAIGIANQRETTIVWDKESGQPVCNAIVWQCRRTADIINKLEKDGYASYIKETTGLIPDAYFSGSKISWILNNIDGAREKAESGELLFGTVDTWLIWKLTQGKVHATDYTNASRTMVYDIHKLDWDDTLLKTLGIPRQMLPEVRRSGELYGYTDIQGDSVAIAGVAGDQQAALFGQRCFKKGEAKNTYGTGCFLLMNTGDSAIQSENGLITTIAASVGSKPPYALEGSVFTGGAVVQWMRDEMRFFSESREVEQFARQVENSGGVYIVPAFTGLGAPYWNMFARGSIFGITRGTTREHIIRAAEESIAYQSYDLINAMEKDSGYKMNALRADGGASRDSLLMQFQADISGFDVVVPKIVETTALGAAYLAGLTVGVWDSPEDIRKFGTQDTVYCPNMDNEKRETLLDGWHKAVSRSLDWEEG